jgi:hypothetical protein
MRKEFALAAVVAGLTLALLPSPAPAVVEPTTTASVCAECCPDDGQCTALAALADLGSSVAELVPDAGLATSLQVKVVAATRSVLALQPGTALNQLGAFDDELTAADKTGRIPHNVFMVVKTIDKATTQLIAEATAG